MQSPTILKPGKRAYYKKIIRMFGSSLIAYWPLWESSGSVAADKSGNARHGAYTGVDFGYPGVGDGKKSPYFDGANDYVDIYSAGLAGAFNGNEGTVMLWAKVSAAGVWIDGMGRYALYLSSDINNIIRLYKSTTNNVFYLRRTGSAVSSLLTLSAQSQTGWVNYALTWSLANDRVRGFLNGSQYSVDVTGLGTWAGALNVNTTLLGALAKTPSYVYSGYLAHALILNREATPTEVAIAAKVP